MSSPSDYYEVLGIAKDADGKQLKKAWRKKALRYHPDRLIDKTAEEQREGEERFKELSEAYEVLSDPEQRSEYDRLGHLEWRRRKREGSVRSAGEKSPGTKGEYRDYYKSTFDAIFGEGGILGPEGKSFWDSSLFGSGNFQREHEDNILLPENDWGLLAALKKAYEIDGDGKWRVRKSPEDERGFVPSEIYHIVKEDGRVNVYRTVTDWRHEWRRDETIEVRSEKSFLEKEKEIKPDSFLGEYYLSGKGRERLNITLDIPQRYDEYLDALKNIARKLARSEIIDPSEISEELKLINKHTDIYARNVRVEGKLLGATDKNREWARPIKLEGVSRRLDEAENTVVQIEGNKKGKEGQPKGMSMSEGNIGDPESGY